MSAIRLRDILRETAEKHGVSVDDMIGSRRFRRIAMARREFCYRAMAETGKSAPLIGRILRRHHTTVLYSAACHAFANELPAPRGSTFEIIQRRTMARIRTQIRSETLAA